MSFLKKDHSPAEIESVVDAAEKIGRVESLLVSDTHELALNESEARKTQRILAQKEFILQKKIQNYNEIKERLSSQKTLSNQKQIELNRICDQLDDILFKSRNVEKEYLELVDEIDKKNLLIQSKERELQEKQSSLQSKRQLIQVKSQSLGIEAQRVRDAELYQNELKAEIAKLDESIKNLETEREEIESLQSKSRLTLNEYQEKIGRLQDQYNKVIIDLTKARELKRKVRFLERNSKKSLSCLLERLSNKTLEMNLLVKDIALSKKSIEKINLASIQAQEDLTHLSSVTSKEIEKREILEQQLDHLTNNHQKLTTKLKSIKQELTTRLGTCTSLEVEISRTKEENQKIIHLLEESKTCCSSLEKKLQVLTNDRIESLVTHDQLCLRKKESSDRLDFLHAKISELEDEILNSNNEVRELANQNIAYDNELIQESETVSRLEAALQTLKSEKLRAYEAAKESRRQQEQLSLVIEAKVKHQENIASLQKEILQLEDNRACYLESIKEQVSLVKCLEKEELSLKRSRVDINRKTDVVKKQLADIVSRKTMIELRMVESSKNLALQEEELRTLQKTAVIHKISMQKLAGEERKIVELSQYHEEGILQLKNLDKESSVQTSELNEKYVANYLGLNIASLEMRKICQAFICEQPAASLLKDNDDFKASLELLLRHISVNNIFINRITVQESNGSIHINLSEIFDEADHIALILGQYKTCVKDSVIKILKINNPDTDKLSYSVSIFARIAAKTITLAQK